MKTVNIVIPVYNAEQYLERCIESLLKQTLDGMEFILVNDCSTDSSLDILEKYKEKYPELIKLISFNENMRQGAARNAGIDLSESDYIGFVDADDWVDASMFEKLYCCAVTNNYDIVGCHNFVVNKNGDIVSISKGNTFAQVGILDGDKRKKLLVNGGNIWFKIYRRSLLNKIRFLERLSYEDNYFIPIAFLYCNSFGLVDEPLYYYYLSENVTIRTSNSNTQFQRFETLKLLIQKVKMMEVYEKYQTEFDYLKIVLFYLNTAKLCVIHYKPWNIKMLFHIRKYMKKIFLKYYTNIYYKTRISKIDRLLLRLNDILAYVYASCFALIWKIYNIRRKVGNYD